MGSITKITNLTQLIVLFLSLQIPLSLSAGAGATTPGKTYRLTVLHTNDAHGHFWKTTSGEHGFAAQKTLVDQIRREVKDQGGHVLLLSAGDINTGTPRSDLLHAEPDIKAMNLL